VRSVIEKLARSQAPVYITGESAAARSSRLADPQQGVAARKGFVPVNCGAIPENLMESEFFGYKKGAFTGAEGDRDGFFQAANAGTLFLDEVADLRSRCRSSCFAQYRKSRCARWARPRKTPSTCELSARPIRIWPLASKPESSGRTCTTVWP